MGHNALSALSAMSGEDADSGSPVSLGGRRPNGCFSQPFSRFRKLWRLHRRQFAHHLRYRFIWDTAPGDLSVSQIDLQAGRTKQRAPLYGAQMNKLAGM